MPFFLKYKNWIIGILVLILVVVVYKTYANKKAGKDTTSNGCPNSFTLHPFGTLVANAVSINYSMSGGKYFSQASGGYGGYNAELAPKEISKDAFMKACDQYKATQSTPNS